MPRARPACAVPLRVLLWVGVRRVLPPPHTPCCFCFPGEGSWHGDPR